MASRGIRSISVPITFGAVTVPLSAALLVGWTIFTARSIQESGSPSAVWLLVLGVISFIVIMSVLVMFTVLLAREILEVRRQTGFIDSVTHELKSPLASLKLCLQTLEREGVPEDKRAALRGMMRDDVDRLDAFIDDVLQASRLAHDGNAPSHLDDAPLAALTRRAVETVVTKHKLEASEIDVAIDEALVVHTDAAALEIVIRNLVDNAVKYSDRPASVRVEAKHDDDKRETWLEVHDRGIGIAKGDLKRVFQRFYRVPSEGVRKRKGTGLGLFVVSALVRNVGGSVEARSEGPGAGTTMRVRLPWRERPTASARA